MSTPKDPRDNPDGPATLVEALPDGSFRVTELPGPEDEDEDPPDDPPRTDDDPPAPVPRGFSLPKGARLARMLSEEGALLPVGNASKFDERYIKQVERLAMLGLTTDEIAVAFGVNRSTIFDWRSTHPGFREAHDRGRVQADANVARALYRAATGYSHRATKIMQYEGEVITKDYIERYPPNAVAAIFWLKNRQPELWREKVDLTHAGGDTPVRVENAASTEALAKIDRLRNLMRARFGPDAVPAEPPPGEGADGAD